VKFRFILELFNSFNFVLAPPTCIFCGKVIENNPIGSNHICSDCWENLPQPKNSKDILERFDQHFGAENNPFSFAFSLFDSEGNHQFLEIIHYFKYSKFTQIGKFTGKLLGEKIKDEIEKMQIKVDYIVPVPIHLVRKRERTFNQSEIIGQAISKVTAIPLETKLLKRVVYTESQTQLGFEERISNVSKAFAITRDKAFVENKNFIIVDDVLTTGSTLYYCGKLLKEYGAQRLMLAVLTTA
jgi:ComF family protein